MDVFCTRQREHHSSNVKLSVWILNYLSAVSKILGRADPVVMAGGFLGKGVFLAPLAPGVLGIFFLENKIVLTTVALGLFLTVKIHNPQYIMSHNIIIINNRTEPRSVCVCVRVRAHRNTYMFPREHWQMTCDSERLSLCRLVRQSIRPCNVKLVVSNW